MPRVKQDANSIVRANRADAILLDICEFFNEKGGADWWMEKHKIPAPARASIKPGLRGFVIYSQNATEKRIANRGVKKSDKPVDFLSRLDMLGGEIEPEAIEPEADETDETEA